MRWAVDRNGKFKKILAVVLMCIGMAIVLGLDKDFKVLLIENGFTGLSGLESEILENVDRSVYDR